MDYLLPHAFHFQQSQAQFNQMLERLSPNKCVLHFSSRDLRPKNYPLWIKTPELIDELTDWVASYPGDNLAGVLFFNYHGTSPTNRRAVYEQLREFDTGAM